MTTSFAIAEVKALVRQPQRTQAQQLLQRLAAAVLLILTRRRFRVRRMLEYFPTDGALLGMNVKRRQNLRPSYGWPCNSVCVVTTCSQLTNPIAALHSETEADARVFFAL